MKRRRTKIVITLGPATASRSMIERAIKAGANVIRLNFSHGSLAEHARWIRRIRSVSKKLARPIGILADLPGPKLRTGEMRDNGSVFLKRGAVCTLTTRAIEGTAEIIPILHRRLPALVHKGDRILLADGLLELRVLRTDRSEIRCRVVVGGELGAHKGINLPGRKLAIPALTKRDREILRFVLRTGVDFVALSFVQEPEDVLEARRWMKRFGRPVPLIAKIEKPQAVLRIDAILKVSDGIMIARGDLGVEIPAAEVPAVQKQLIRRATATFKPVITATQMLDSMAHNPRPTRAETTDVANAIWDGSDAVMLSNETATGRYPIEAIRTMAEIIDNAEEHSDFRWNAPETHDYSSDSQVVLRAATEVCRPGIHQAVVTYTQTGSTAILLSKLRPGVPIFALTPEPRTCRRLTLLWGVESFLSPVGGSVDQMLRSGDRVLLRHAGLHAKDRVVLVAGTRLTTGATNLMKIHRIGESM